MAAGWFLGVCLCILAGFLCRHDIDQKVKHRSVKSKRITQVYVWKGILIPLQNYQSRYSIEEFSLTLLKFIALVDLRKLANWRELIAEMFQMHVLFLHYLCASKGKLSISPSTGDVLSTYLALHLPNVSGIHMRNTNTLTRKVWSLIQLVLICCFGDCKEENFSPVLG